MNDKDFDKIFSKKLKEEKSLPIDERSWEALASRLDENDHKKGVVGMKTRPLAWLLPLLLLLLGMNVWSFLKINQAEKQNLILSNEIKELKSVVLKRDTIIQTQYIYKTDTVFINAPTPKRAIKALSLNLNKNKNLSLFATNTPPSVFEIFEPFSEEKQALKDNKIPLIESHNSDKRGNKIIQKENFETSPVGMPLAKPYNYPAVINSLPLLKGLAIEEIKAKPEIILLTYPISAAPPIIENRKINRFYIGSSAGFINYHTLWRNKDGLEIGRNEKSYQVGLKMEYALTANWRVTASTDYCPYNFNIKWLDNRYNLPPTPTYYNPTTSTLNSIVGSQKLYLGALGVKYVFTQNSRWQPYIGTAYTAMRIEPFEAEYTFTHTATNKTYANTTHLKGGATIQKIALLNGGMEFRFNKHIVAQGEGFYYKDMNKVKKTFDLFGLRGAILVGF